MAEQEHVSGKIGSHALQGDIATHVHKAEAQGDQLDSQCFIFLLNVGFLNHNELTWLLNHDEVEAIGMVHWQRGGALLMPLAKKTSQPHTAQ